MGPPGLYVCFGRQFLPATELGVGVVIAGLACPRAATRGVAFRHQTPSRRGAGARPEQSVPPPWSSTQKNSDAAVRRPRRLPPPGCPGRLPPPGCPGRLPPPGCPGRLPPGDCPAFGVSVPRPREVGRGHGPPLDHDTRARRDKPASRTSATLGAVSVLQSRAGEWRSGLDVLPFLWHRGPAELRCASSSLPFRHRARGRGQSLLLAPRSRASVFPRAGPPVARVKWRPGTGGADLTRGSTQRPSVDRLGRLSRSGTGVRGSMWGSRASVFSGRGSWRPWSVEQAASGQAPNHDGQLPDRSRCQAVPTLACLILR
jgi:hypothetical protein